MTLDTEAVGREVVSFEAEAPRLRQEIAREVARRVRRSRLSEAVTSEDKEDAVAAGLGAIFEPVQWKTGDWWDHYGADVVHDKALVIKFGADRAMQYLGRKVAGQRRERDAQAQWLRHVLPLMAVGDPTADSAVRSVIREKERSKVRAAVEALDKPERMVIEARYWAGETWANIASTQGITIGKAHRLHDAALRQLAYWLRPTGNTASRG